MIKILIADDHPIMREGLKHVLAKDSGISVVGEITDAYEIPAFCKEHEVNVLLLDIFMPGPGLLETVTRLTSGFPDLKILILSMHPEDELVLRALKAGAMGYVNKNKTVDHLAKAIRSVYNGDVYWSATLANLMTRVLRGGGDQEDSLKLLSKREYEVLQMLASGLAIQDIAVKLSLSPKTISTYRARVLEKLGLHSNADLVRYVIEHETKTGNRNKRDDGSSNEGNNTA